MHEDFSRAEEIERSSDRSFGLVIAAGFSILAFFPLFLSPPGAIRWWALVIAAAFAGLAVFWTAPLAPLGRLWFLLGLVLGRIVNPIVLALLFYFVVLPIGLLMRISSKGQFASRRNRAGESYWVRRDPSGPPPETMKRQF
jgi:cobalamin biosynthesis protein CobD/CbiB